MTSIAAPVVNRSDEAITILQNTQDGDLLHPRDLKLVERVVNGAPLTPAGEEYWNNLVLSAREGRYTSDWFCGIEGLTRHHQGHVYWKGKEVEHYDLIPGREDWVHQQARILAAICKTIDTKGEVVSGSSVAAVYRRMHCADGMTTPRFLVGWAIKPAGFEMHTRELIQSDRPALMKEIEDRTLEIYQALGMAGWGVRVSEICTKEDFTCVVDTIKGDARWAQRALKPAYQRSDVADAVLHQFQSSIPSDRLITQQAVREHFLEPALSEIAAAADAQLSNNEFRFERAVG